MVKVFYWQWGKRVEHDEEFDTLDEALGFLYGGGVPQQFGGIAQFAPDEIAVDDRRIVGDELDEMLDDYEMRPYRSS